jgi:hypothetical protein
VALGIALAWSWREGNPARSGAVAQPLENAVQAVPAPVSDGATLDPVETPADRVYGASGVALEAFRADDVFVGYAVVRSHDARLSVGDIVTAIDGQSVEEGAAGSELLLAMLRNPEAEITLQSRADWASR